MSTEDAPEAELSFARDLPRTRAAIAFAADRHRFQRRDGDGARFLAHPVEVAALLRRLGYEDDVVAAAILHDVLEDTDAERRELEAHFGRRVSELVAEVSDDSSIGDEDDRKEELRRRVGRSGSDARAVYAADKVSKVRELRMLMAGGLDEDAVEVKHARYRRALEMLEREHGDERLLELLRFELEALERLPPHGGRSSAP